MCAGVSAFCRLCWQLQNAESSCLGNHGPLPSMNTDNPHPATVSSLLMQAETLNRSALELTEQSFDMSFKPEFRGECFDNAVCHRVNLLITQSSRLDACASQKDCAVAFLCERELESGFERSGTILTSCPLLTAVEVNSIVYIV